MAEGGGRKCSQDMQPEYSCSAYASAAQTAEGIQAAARREKRHGVGAATLQHVIADTSASEPREFSTRTRYSGNSDSSMHIVRRTAHISFASQPMLARYARSKRPVFSSRYSQRGLAALSPISSRTVREISLRHLTAATAWRKLHRTATALAGSGGPPVLSFVLVPPPAPAFAARRRRATRYAAGR